MNDQDKANCAEIIAMIDLEIRERDNEKRDNEKRTFFARSILFSDEELALVRRAIKFYRQKGGNE